MKFLLEGLDETQEQHGISNDNRSPVERGDDRVLDALGDVVPVPLPDAWAASVGQYRTACFLQDSCESRQS